MLRLPFARSAAPAPLPAAALAAPPAASAGFIPPLPGAAFRPTGLQRRFFARIAAGATVATALDALRIHRATFSRWRQDPNFRSWLAAACLRDMLLNGWELINVARQNASADFRFRKAAFDLTFNPATRRHLAAWAQWCGGPDVPAFADSGAELAAEAELAAANIAENVANDGVTD
ncbi:MAG: hypothetical protein ACRD2E_11415 [Terriglobales bacterium]